MGTKGTFNYRLLCGFFIPEYKLTHRENKNRAMNDNSSPSTNFLQPDDYNSSLKITRNKLERTRRTREAQCLREITRLLSPHSQPLSSSSLHSPYPFLLLNLPIWFSSPLPSFKSKFKDLHLSNTFTD